MHMPDNSRGVDHNIRRNLKYLMDVQDLSISGLARAAGCSRSVLSRYLTGKVKNKCGMDRASRLALALGVPLHKLVSPHGIVPKVRK
mgnify:CR=1 FL=1